MKCRKRGIFTAVQFDGLLGYIKEFEGVDCCYSNVFDGMIMLSTSGDAMSVKIDDWIVRNDKGIFFVYSPNEFESIFEVVLED